MILTSSKSIGVVLVIKKSSSLFKVIINKRVILARFGVIHCLSASICFWISTIIREILESIASKRMKKEADEYDENTYSVYDSGEKVLNTSSQESNYQY